MNRDNLTLADEELKTGVQFHIFQFHGHNGFAVCNGPFHFSFHELGVLGIIGQKQHQAGALFQGVNNHMCISAACGDIVRGHPAGNSLLAE